MAFPTTKKSLIGRLLTKDTSRRGHACDEVTAGYWKPVLAFCLNKCWSSHNRDADAMDLTVGFFADKLLSEDFIRSFDAARKFRPFLITVLSNYVSQEMKKERSERMLCSNAVSLHGLDRSPPIEPVDLTDAAFCLHYEWAVQRVHEALKDVEDGLHEAALEIEWKVFAARVADPAMANSAPVPSAELCRMHGFQHEWQITRIVKRVSARYHRALWLAVRETVSSDDAVEEELEELRKVLSDPRARRRPERGPDA